MRTKGDGAKAAMIALQSYRQQIDEMNAELGALENDQAALRGQLAQTLAELAAWLLPDALPERVQEVMAATQSAELGTRRAWFEGQRGGWGARLAQIEATPEFQNRQNLLDPASGELARLRFNLKRALAASRDALQRFDIEPMRWIESRRAQAEATQSGFSGFWRAVTFTNYRMERAKAQASHALGYQSYEALEADYHQAIEGVRQATESLGRLTAQHDALVALVEEHGKLYSWVHNFEESLTQTLRAELVRQLEHLDMIGLRRQLGRHPGGKLAGKAQGLQEKLRYLQEMSLYLHREIGDRNNRGQSIERTLNLWRAKPYEPLASDKTKWLLTVPELKKKGTAKRLRWMRRMHRNVADFEDWDDYDLYLIEGLDFYSYDAFGYGAEEPMPWEGFAREVLPDLGPYRDAQGLEKKDYSLFQEVEQKYQEGAFAETAGERGAEAGGAAGQGSGIADAAGLAAVAAVAAVVASEVMEAAELTDQS